MKIVTINIEEVDGGGIHLCTFLHQSKRFTEREKRVADLIEHYANYLQEMADALRKAGEP